MALPRMEDLQNTYLSGSETVTQGELLYSEFGLGYIPDVLESCGIANISHVELAEINYLEEDYDPTFHMDCLMNYFRSKGYYSIVQFCPVTDSSQGMAYGQTQLIISVNKIPKVCYCV